MLYLKYGTSNRNVILKWKFIFQVSTLSVVYILFIKVRESNFLILPFTRGLACALIRPTTRTVVHKLSIVLGLAVSWKASYVIYSTCIATFISLTWRLIHLVSQSGRIYWYPSNYNNLFVIFQWFVVLIFMFSMWLENWIRLVVNLDILLLAYLKSVKRDL